MLLEIPSIFVPLGLPPLEKPPLSGQLFSNSSAQLTEEPATLYLDTTVVGEFKSLLIKNSDEAAIIPINLLCGYLCASTHADLQAGLLTAARFRVVTKSLVLNDYRITWSHTQDQSGEKIVCNCLEGLWLC